MVDLHNPKISVVVVGGGSAGANITRDLSKILDPARHTLTLVTARQTYTYLPASLRALVDPDFPLSTVFMPYDNVFGSFPGQLIHGSVTLIEENKRSPILMHLDDVDINGGSDVMYSGSVVYRVALGAGEEKEEALQRVLYDVLVVATGSQWEGLTGFPNSMEECMKHVETWRIKFRDANNIVIAGGGAVGLETAGEIKDIYPNKNITIVHADRLPLNDIYPDRFRSLITERLCARGINFILNDTIQGNPIISPSSPKIETQAGISIPCDLLVPARGGRPSTLPLSFLTPSPLTSRGFVKVQPTLQLQHHPNIFAAGDIVDLPEIRQLVKIMWGHKGVVVENVAKVVRGIEHGREEGKATRARGMGEKTTGKAVSADPNKGLRKYRGVWEIMLITNGKSSGLTYCGLFGGIVLGDWWTRKLKSRDLMVNDARRALALNPL